MEKIEPRIRHTCEFCGVTFWSKRPDSRFHNAACRQRAFRWRKRLQTWGTRSICSIQEVAAYLAHPDSRETAIEVLKAISAEIENIRQTAGIRRVH